MNWSEFFNMGGYALYVWCSYGLMALILLVNLVQIPLRRASVMRKIQRAVRMEKKKS